mgnify:CR=1 FL=1|jgi:hypothetical protein
MAIRSCGNPKKTKNGKTEEREKNGSVVRKEGGGQQNANN